MDVTDRTTSVSSLFRACDLDGSGYIDRNELAQICPELSSRDLKDVFAALDKDGDGRIGKEEFSRGFKELNEAMGALRDKKHARNNSNNSIDEVSVEEFIGDLDEGLQTLSCQEQVCELYQQLHHAGNPEMLEIFESVVLGVLKDLRQVQVENERLEKSFKREKEQHERHMRQLEEEMEIQMQRIEERARKSEQEKTESEKAEMRDQVQEEINMLQQNLKRLQTEGPEARNKEIEDQLLHLKGKVEEMTFANRQLRSELTDAQTNLALTKSEVASIKHQLNEKTHELDLEKETVAEYQREQENLSRQLHLLHDANKRLHDTNDDLREAIETTRRTSPMRQQSLASNASTIRSVTSDLRRGSLMSEYFMSAPMIRSRLGSTNSLAEESGVNGGHVTVQTLHPGHRSIPVTRLPHQDTCESDTGLHEDIDSGHSTLREGNDVDLDNEAFLNDAETMMRVLNGKRLTRSRSTQPPLMEHDLDSIHDDVETETEVSFVDNKLYRNVTDVRRVGSGSSRSSSSRSSRSRENSVGRSHRRPSSLTQDSTAKMTQQPDRMFKVVLAGDAAVGKSSLIMRLCKGKFYENLSSTLGVDFQTKMIELDGRTIALQLWDTAGQERFRSIAKSYFRRADGVLLLYDCTYERSFMSIREWMDSIESSQDGSIKKLPIMLCANKTDMREESEQQGRKCVTYTDGQRLARDYGALFIETSAKEGTNVSEAVCELARLMRANEDLEVKTSGLQLHEKKDEASKGCCGR